MDLAGCVPRANRRRPTHLVRRWQITYAFDPIRFEPGDQLELTCLFDNTAANQLPGAEPTDVNWGEGSDQEMCVANLYVSEP